MTGVLKYWDGAAWQEVEISAPVGPQGPAGVVQSATPPSDTSLIWADTSVPDVASAPVDPTFVTLSTNGTLTNERVLTAGAGITLTDGGAGSTVTVASTAILPTVVDAKGDLIVGTGADAVARLAVGAESTTLVANSNATGGVSWMVDGLTRLLDSGTWYNSMSTVYGAVGSASLAQRAFWFPFFVPRRATVAGIRADVSTLESGATLRVGLYQMTDLKTVGALIADYGTLDGSSTGIKTASGSSTVGPGWFLVCGWGSNHTTVRWVRPAYSTVLGGVMGYPTTSEAEGYFAWTTSPVDYSGGLPSSPTPGLYQAVTTALTRTALLQVNFQ